MTTKKTVLDTEVNRILSLSDKEAIAEFNQAAIAAGEDQGAKMAKVMSIVPSVLFDAEHGESNGKA